MSNLANNMKAVAKNQDQTQKDRFARADSAPPLFDTTAAIPPKEGKGKVEKVERNSFSFPKSDHDLINSIYERCLDHRKVVTNSEIVRAAIRAFSQLSNEEIIKAIEGLEKVKAGRKSK